MELIVNWGNQSGIIYDTTVKLLIRGQCHTTLHTIITMQERVLGIDPGLLHLGYGIIDTDGRQSRLVTYGCINPDPKQSLPERLRAIHDAVQGIVREFQPRCIAYESLLYHRNVRTALLMGQARGAAIVAGAALNVTLVEFSPTAVKKAVVGKGKAGKEQVQKMVQLLLGLAKPPEPDHAADALAIALTYAHGKNVKFIIERQRR